MTQADGRFDRRTFIKYGGLVSTGTLLAGCTGNQSADETTTDSGGDPTTESNDGGTETGEGETTNFTYATTQTPSTIDPMKVSDNLETILAHNVYDPLLYYSNETPPKLQPWLATDWSVADDNRTYTFQLREDATFHNGDAVTADDVVYSFTRMLEVNEGFSWMFSDHLSLDGVSAVDETTVEVKLDETFAPFLYTLPFLFIVNKAQVEANAEGDDYGSGWLEDNDAGSGPYALTSRQRNQRIVMERHADWWGTFADGNVYERVTTEMVQEAATVSGMMEDGSAHMSDQWLPLQTYKELEGVEGVTVSSKATFNPFYIFMHNQRAPLDDENVRKAISFAFDYEAALNDVMAGDSDHLNGPLPSAMWSHTDDLETYGQDMEQAQKHLDQSDYSAGDIDLTYTYVSGLTVEENMGLLLQSNLNELGINLSIEKAPWSKITSMTTSQESTPDMLAVYLSFSYADPDTFLYPAWHSESHGSWTSASWYSNEQVDQLLTEARQTVGQENRVPIYEEAQRLIADDAPALFVMNQATRNALAETVNGFNDNGVTGYRQTFHWFTSDE